jgi:hypothetical protein
MADDVSEFRFYHYNPSMGAAVVFIIAFIITTAMHTWQLFRTRTWFMIPLVIGGYCKAQLPWASFQLFSMTDVPFQSSV